MPKRRKHRERYLETRRRANGVVSFYYCPPSKDVKAGFVTRAALGTDFAGAIAKARRYNEILDARRRGEDSAPCTPSRGSIAWGAQRFRASWQAPGTRRKRLSESARKDYDSYLARLVDLPLKGGGRLGDLPMSALTAQHAQRLYEIFGKADAEGRLTARRAGGYAMTVFRRLWTVIGKAELKLADNPFAGLPRR